MNKSTYEQQRNDYVASIQNGSEAIQSAEKILAWKENYDILAIKQKVLSQVDDVLHGYFIQAFHRIQRYSDGISYFLKKHGTESSQIQVGRLFGFRPEKFVGTMDIKNHWPVLIIEFSNMQDLLFAKFAKRKEQFSQEDRASGFYKVLHFDGKEIPVCVNCSGHDTSSTTTHELTHFRNHIIGMDYYGKWWGRSMYEVCVYDDLQEEILAFFSEWLKRAYVQMWIVNDQRYAFYKRIEGYSSADRQRFYNDLSRFIDIARQVKYIRPETYHIELAMMPIHQWQRYLGYLQQRK